MMNFFKLKPGVISEGPLWCCISECWLYEHETLLGLLWKMLTEWQNDKHLVG